MEKTLHHQDALFISRRRLADVSVRKPAALRITRPPCDPPSSMLRHARPVADLFLRLAFALPSPRRDPAGAAQY